MEAEKQGTEQIKKAVVLILALTTSVDFIVRHPELGVTRFAKLTDCFDELMAMSTFDAEKLKLEYKDLDAAEKAELGALVKEKFDIEDDKLEAKVEEGIDLFAEGYEFVTKALKFVKAIQA